MMRFLSTLLLTASIGAGAFMTGCGTGDAGATTPPSQERAGGSGGAAGPAGSGGAGASGGAFASGGMPAAGGAGDNGGSGGSGSGSGGSGGSITGDAAGDDAGPGPPAPASDAGPSTAPVTAPGSADAPNFFITSMGSGALGGNMGGLAGADDKCTKVAAGAGFRNKKWVAYVSVNHGPGGGPVQARDRIGNGPWYNSKGLLFAENLAKLHPMIDPLTNPTTWVAYKNAIPAKPLFVDEKGAPVPHAEHGIWTGSDGQGMVIPDKTCKDWTSSDMADRGQVGHADLPAVIVNPGHSPSWNSAHDAACAQNSSASGRLHCFAIE